ncbi:DUF397 domain-containing protein [Nocardiopsis sp. EMB25]|nr:DUF397 domain-containing protein [Nocardiopsis sp. EMB25]
MAELPTGSTVRDSQNPDHTQLASPASEWRTFLRQVKVQDH